MAGIGKVTDGDFATEVEGSSTPVLVDFWAEWCGPCRMMNPVLEELQGELGDSLRIVKLNVDENPDTSAKFQVLSIPTMLLFKDGEVVKQLVGAMPKQRLQESLNEFVSASA